MKYDIKWLNSFIVFAESKNIVEAADRLQISQPALSAHLKSFEDQLPQAVFAMQGRKKVLTKLGKNLYLDLKDRLSGMDRAVENVLLQNSDEDQAQIKIGGRSEIMSRVLRASRFPGQMTTFDLDSKTAVQQLLKSQLDIGFVTERPDSLQLIAKTLFSYQFQIICPIKMKIESSVINQKMLNELAALPLLSYKEDFDQLNTMRTHFGVQKPQQVFRVFSDWQVLIDLCEKGLGWTLAPTSFLFDEKKVQRFLVSTEIISASSFYMVYPKSHTKMKWFSELTTEIKKIF